jgi:hypothetical protein
MQRRGSEVREALVDGLDAWALPIVEESQPGLPPRRRFDTADHSFGIKWNGIRALEAVEASGW